jgi:hypothetical protein
VQLSETERFECTGLGFFLLVKQERWCGRERISGEKGDLGADVPGGGRTVAAGLTSSGSWRFLP